MRAKFSAYTAAGQGLANCRTCALLNDASHSHCVRCHSKLSLRTRHSVQKTLALLLSAMVFYIPANTLPIMKTSVLGSAQESTILSGVWLFFDQGAYFVASVIFTASILIPVAKVSVLLWLCYQTRGAPASSAKLTRLYQITEFIGKWSMIDVFVVAILVALIQVGSFMSITPGLASASFAVVVILTMLAAQCFDARLLWDRAQHKR